MGRGEDMKLKKDDVVEIIWMDANSDADWQSEEELISLARVRTCGIFLKQDRKCLWVCGDITDGGSIGSQTVIPRSLVVSIKRMK